jgi:hypothetical protein
MDKSRTKKNPLNILTLHPGYSWKNPSCWVKNIKFEFRKFKYAWQRITKGYSDWDLWDLDVFYQYLFSNSINEFSDNTMGYPGNTEFPTFEDWQNYLKQMSFLFKESIEGEESLKNEYWDEYCAKILDDPNYFNNLNKEMDATKKTLQKKYFERENDIATYRNDCLNKALDMLKHIFGHLWW